MTICFIWDILLANKVKRGVKMKKLLTLLVVFAIIFNVSAFASTNKPLKNLGGGLDDMAYGDLEIPDNANETQTKGTPAYPDCTTKTNDGTGRGIARFVGGLWKVATFWYPESTSTTSSTASKTTKKSR